MRPASPPQHAFAAALLDPTQAPPTGLRAQHGSDPGLRFAGYRNNVVHSLVAVLGDTFPVVRQLVGEDLFGAMARLFVAEHPPTSPLMHRYGGGFPDWVADFEPATDLPYLSDLVRLEWARLRAFHAADADPIDAQVLVAVLQAPDRLAVPSLILHPSLAVVQSPHPVVSLWSAHQLDVPRPAGRSDAPSNSFADRAVTTAHGLMARVPESAIAMLGRFSVAAVFWKSGQAKIEGLAIDIVSLNFELGVPRSSTSAVDLFRDEYRLPFLPRSWAPCWLRSASMRCPCYCCWDWAHASPPWACW